MKVVGLIVEYNPFHKGHEYHIKESLRITGADAAIVVMSGNFMQRGEPSIMPKHLRAEMALKSGAAMVIELPVRFATASGEGFAHGSIDLLHSLGCVDFLCFGSESGDLEALSKLARFLVEEPAEYKLALKEELRSGVTFARGRALAIKKLEKRYDVDGSLLNEPNNILGIEYLKALYRINSSIKPFTISRNTSKYHDTQLGMIHSSASAIRNSIKGDNKKECMEHVNEVSFKIMEDNWEKRFPIYSNDFSLILWNKLMNLSVEDLCGYEDITEELAHRMINKRNQFSSVEAFCDLLKTKNLTRSRISRCLSHILLGIPVSTVSNITVIDHPTITKYKNEYIHVIGFHKNMASLLTMIQASSSIPLLTKLTKVEGVSEAGLKMIKEDMEASNLYEMIVAHKFQEVFIHELEKSLILL